MQIEILPVLSDNYIYVIIDEGSAAVVDPADAVAVLSHVSKLGVKLKLALVTHYHFDHAAGCRELSNATRCSVVGADDPRAQVLDRPVGDGDVVSLGNIEIRVIAVPGHTSTHVVYHVPEHNILFTGDTLFAGGCGRLFEGTAEQMWNSLEKIRALPDNTLIYCGHEYTLENMEFAAHMEPDNPDVGKRLDKVRQQRQDGLPTVPSTLEMEKNTNPFLRADTEAMRKVVGLPDASPADVLAELRHRKDNW